MASRKISIHNWYVRPGLTLIEVLVVMGMIVILVGLGLVLSMDTFRGFTFRSERDTLVALLQQARSQAINNVCLGTACTNGRPHGVKIESNLYTMFQGPDYAAHDSGVDRQILPSYPLIIAAGSASEVVFQQLSGNVDAQKEIFMTDGFGNSSTITVTNQGGISWTN